MIRYADVLLMKAEALIELNRADEALPLINQIRSRAAASTALLKDINGNPVSNYEVGLYTSMGVRKKPEKNFVLNAALNLQWKAAGF